MQSEIHPNTLSHLLDVTERKKVDPLLIYFLIKQESGWNPHATSYAGAQGLMQVMPFHHGRCGMSNGHDIRQNITCGVGILSSAMKQAKGDYKKALAIYNGGQYGARKYSQGYPCRPGRNDCQQNKHYVAIISRNYESKLAELKLRAGTPK